LICNHPFNYASLDKCFVRTLGFQCQQSRRELKKAKLSAAMTYPRNGGNKNPKD
jgi:hypothetical protein